MKNNVTTLFLAIVMVASFQSCKKFEDGPGISFRSSEKLLQKRWELQSLDINGVDVTADVGNVQMLLEDDNSFHLFQSGFEQTGIWKYDNKAVTLQLNYNDGGRELYEIKRLKKDELRIEGDIADATYGNAHVLMNFN